MCMCMCICVCVVLCVAVVARYQPPLHVSPIAFESGLTRLFLLKALNPSEAHDSECDGLLCVLQQLASSY